MTEVNATTLWERFHGELSAFLRTRVASEATAQDILQSAFLKAHKHLLSGEAPENPRAWMFQIVRNLIIDAHRRSGRELSLAQAVGAEPPPGGEPSTTEEDAFAVVARALPMFIDELEPAMREALRMTEIEGLTQAEAAARAQISLSGMKSRVQRGRKRVFESLQRCCRFEVDARGHMIACAVRGQDDECC